MRVKIYQGASNYPEECAFLGTLEFTGITKAPAGAPDLLMVLTVNVDCILTCKGVIDGVEKELTLNLDTSSDVSQKKDQIQDKNVIRWRRFAAGLSTDKKAELLRLIEEYQNGTATREKVAAFIRQAIDFSRIKREQD